MPVFVDRTRRLLPPGPAGAACAACRVLPLPLAAGVRSAAGWAAAVFAEHRPG